METKIYEAAVRTEYKTADIFKIIKKCFFDLTVVFFMTMKEIFLNLLKSKILKDIKGQLALVTGGANGIGFEIAKRLAAEGCSIIIFDINQNESFKAMMEIRHKFNVKVKVYKVDVSDFKAIQRAKNEIEFDFPGQSVDILVNNAGILSATSLKEGTFQQIQQIININLASHFWMTKIFLNEMIEKKKGHIVGICSLSAIEPIPKDVAYSASKFGTDGFYRALFDELAADNHDDYIFITCIFPNFTETRKEVTKYLEEIEAPGLSLTPEYVAEKTVDAIKRNKSNVFVPWYGRFFSIVSLLPLKVKKFVKCDLMLKKKNQ
ncbi:hypothetical protein PVAND_012372 [Polypedilum vanderplanki]|uniref:Uncharacterized protein n=1 Tax=Polypedilum vanderplanki TaxID=319348 RepID=A0A9J6CLC9_POLVA|nr:hypothetical protein PVAND_012372 [Polypedilum vanderplanki]